MSIRQTPPGDDTPGIRVRRPHLPALRREDPEHRGGPSFRLVLHDIVRRRPSSFLPDRFACGGVHVKTREVGAGRVPPDAMATGGHVAGRVQGDDDLCDLARRQEVRHPVTVPTPQPPDMIASRHVLRKAQAPPGERLPTERGRPPPARAEAGWRSGRYTAGISGSTERMSSSSSCVALSIMGLGGRVVKLSRRPRFIMAYLRILRPIPGWFSYRTYGTQS